MKIIHTYNLRAINNFVYNLYLQVNCEYLNLIMIETIQYIIMAHFELLNNIPTS